MNRRVLLPVLAATLLQAACAFGQATFSLNHTSYLLGEPVTASWTGSTSSTDWIGIYRPGQVPGQVNSTYWRYVSGESGSMSFNTVAQGNWVAYFFANDGYGLMPGTSGVEFEVVNPAPSILTFTSAPQPATSLPVTLSWTLGNPHLIETLHLDDGMGLWMDVSGQSSAQLEPTTNTTYTLYLNFGAQTATRRVLVPVPSSPALAVDATTYFAGQPTVVSWSGATANPDSWIGIYTVPNTPGPQPSTQWNYLNGTRTAGGNHPDGSMSFTLPAGNYYATLFLDNGYIIEQGPVMFSVVSLPAPEVRIAKSGGEVTLSWNSVEGLIYDIFASDVLTPQPEETWTLIQADYPSGGATTTFTETLPSPEPPHRYYWIRGSLP